MLFDESSRTLVLAAHPDDETLGLWGIGRGEEILRLASNNQPPMSS